MENTLKVKSRWETERKVIITQENWNEIFHNNGKPQTLHLGENLHGKTLFATSAHTHTLVSLTAGDVAKARRQITIIFWSCSAPNSFWICVHSVVAHLN